MPEAERTAQHVVTSENRAEFMNHRLDIAKPEPIVIAPETVKVEEKKPEVKAEEKKVEDDEHDDEVKEVKKKNPKIEQRFSDLTAKRKAAEEEAAKAREEAKAANEEREAAYRERDALKAKYEAPKPLGDKPTRDKFATDDEFANALEGWAVEKGARESQAKIEQEAKAKTWSERVTATKTELPDYDAKINAATNVMLSEQVRDAIHESDIGPKLLYHFAEHPEDAARIGKLTVGGALKELGRLEERLSKPTPKAEPEEKKETKQSDKAPIAEISKAPEPIKPLKSGSGAADVPMDSDGNFTGTPAKWRELRKAGKIK